MIDISKPFLLYANCSVIYDGRASSTLSNGNYLVIYKKDKSLLIHASDKSTPRNYQSSGTILRQENNHIIATRKQEKIIINIQDIFNYIELDDWSDNQVVVAKTEKELVDKICKSIDSYLKTTVRTTHLEYVTEYGPVDIMAEDINNIKHVIEVKRKRATLSNVSQLKRYMEKFDNNARGYIASPEISKNANKYLSLIHI